MNLKQTRKYTIPKTGTHAQKQMQANIFQKLIVLIPWRKNATMIAPIKFAIALRSVKAIAAFLKSWLAKLSQLKIKQRMSVISSPQKRMGRKRDTTCDITYILQLDLLNTISQLVTLSQSFKYKERQQQVFDKLNLKINPGQKVALVGPSGCGGSLPCLVSEKICYSSSNATEEDIILAARKAQALRFIAENNPECGSDADTTSKGFDREVGVNNHKWIKIQYD